MKCTKQLQPMLKWRKSQNKMILLRRLRKATFRTRKQTTRGSREEKSSRTKEGNATFRTGKQTTRGGSREEKSSRTKECCNRCPKYAKQEEEPSETRYQKTNK